MSFDPSQYEGVRITKALLSLKHQPVLYVQFQGEPADSDIQIETPGGRNSDKPKEPIKIAPVIDLTTGEEALLICSAVIVSNLNKYAKEKGSYVGKKFKLEEGGIKKDKRYRVVNMFELTPKPPAAPPVNETPAPSDKRERGIRS